MASGDAGTNSICVVSCSGDAELLYGLLAGELRYRRAREGARHTTISSFHAELTGQQVGVASQSVGVAPSSIAWTVDNKYYTAVLQLVPCVERVPAEGWEAAVLVCNLSVVRARARSLAAQTSVSMGAPSACPPPPPPPHPGRHPRGCVQKLGGNQ